MKICIYNNRGGVGKSTLASSIAFRAIEKNISLTLVDLDEQSNSMKWISNDDYVGEESIIRGSVCATRNVSEVVRDGIVVIDAPPSFDFIEKVNDKIGLIDIWIVPVKGRFSLDGAMNLITQLRDYGRGHERIVFVSNNTDITSEFGRRQLEEAKSLGVEVFKYPIGRNMAFEKSEEMLCSVWSVPYSSRSTAVQNLLLFADWALKGCNLRSTHGDSELNKINVGK